MSKLTPNTSNSTELEKPVIEAIEVDVIYHNMNASSDFITFRVSSSRGIKFEVQEVARHLKNDCYTLISMNASKSSMVIVFATALSKAELKAKGFPFPIPEEDDHGAEGQ